MPVMNPDITIIKRNIQGQEMVRYPARTLSRGSGFVIVEAFFNRPDQPVLDAVLKKGDRFVEIYYTERWYAIFAVYDREDDRLKGWYCNIGRPAVWESDVRLSYVDLALDLWVAPDRTRNVLDEDEFAALKIDGETRQKAQAALEELQNLFAENKNPDLF